ncbi:ISL3 family transposase, partial [Mycobacterium heckeshornense]
RGGKLDPEWANRRRLLTAWERLSDKNFATMWNAIVAEDDTGQILSAWIAKEEPRTLLSTVHAGGDAHLTRHRLHRFLAWCIDSQIPELLTLAATVDTWWPEINAFIATGITNARTEGYNRLVKQVKRAACGFRNQDNSARRIRFHCTRKQRAATQTSC